MKERVRRSISRVSGGDFRAGLQDVAPEHRHQAQEPAVSERRSRRRADALLVEHPVRTELTEAEIKRIADCFYAHELGADEGLREEGIGSDPVFADVHHQLAEAGIEFETPFTVAEQTGPGLSDRMMHKIAEDVSTMLPAVKQALSPLGHRQKHHAPVRGQPTAIEGSCDFLGLNGWKRERQNRIIGHGGRGIRGWLRNRILRRISALHHARQPLRHPLANKTG